MGMQAGGGSGGLNSEINVTPMVDIMLVLLIIFMVVTPFLQQGVTVPIPREMMNPDEDHGDQQRDFGNRFRGLSPARRSPVYP